jgi:hypothetical protein
MTSIASSHGETAYIAKGRQAYRDGKAYIECPYLTFPHCTEGNAWKNGWLAERDATCNHSEKQP